MLRENFIMYGIYFLSITCALNRTLAHEDLHNTVKKLAMKRKKIYIYSVESYC